MKGAGETQRGNARCGAWTRRRSKTLKGSLEAAITQSPLKPRKMRVASQVGDRKDGSSGQEGAHRARDRKDACVWRRTRCVAQLQEGNGTR
jgi:hypothetical protein